MRYWDVGNLDRVVMLLSAGPFTLVNYWFLRILLSEHAARGPQGCPLNPDVTRRELPELPLRSARGPPPVGNGSNLVQVNETQLSTRYDQSRSFRRTR